ncbi:hypothetical protein EDD18DRAFT_1112735 [Armillaria luteobubalina]|uniref:BTB domain-containing protein n=1 Tax=Armillaria luteobubalina TaxID=153913 RepID=A0AA39PD70_9AGAR|nr:hypothetical protein EDD18DRAFT_1112735 [Armillaria luteobubalina]
MFSSTRSLPRSQHSTGHSKKSSIAPSLSSTMNWLSRSSSSVSVTQAARHKSSRSIEIMSPRYGSLGTGATIVRTPDEALKDSGVRLTYEDSSPTEETYHGYILDEKPEDIDRPLPPPPPPLPFELESDEEGELLDSDYDDDERIRAAPPRPTRALPPCPTISHSQPAKAPSYTASSDSFPPPPFRAILLSDAPTSTVDRSKVIVTLETCTHTHKTTFDTLTSQSSHLSDFLAGLFPRTRNMSDASSIYSTNSDDMQACQTPLQLAPTGFSHSPFYLHVFLDRPSEPYPHILAYLRCHPQYSRLPRLDIGALLDLRDEATFLGLTGLQALCAEEIRRLATVAPSVHSMCASVHSNLLERTGREMQRPGTGTGTAHDTEKSLSDGGVGFRSPPTPQSWTKSRTRESTSTSSRRSPAGWI